MAKMKVPQRQVAHKLWISDIVNSNYVKKEGWDPNYIEFGDGRVSRVNVLATVVGKFVSEDGNYASMTLDDGTETIRAKAFGPDVIKVSEVNVGKLVRFVGKVKKYEDEIYLSPEIIHELDDPNWILVRKIELHEPKKKDKEKEPEESEEETKEEKPEKEPQSEKEEKTSEKSKEEKPEESEKNMNSDILQIIKELDKGEGADMKKVLEKSGLDTEEGKKFLFGLLKRGEVFEPKKGKLKVLD